MAIMICNTIPGCPAWERHIAEIERLKAQAKRAKNSPLELALAELLLAHKAAAWQSSLECMTEKLRAWGER